MHGYQAWIRTFAVAGAIATVAAPAARASSYGVIYTFPTTNQLAPQLGAVRNGVIYGVDPSAGSHGDGVLFTISGGTYAPLYTFSGTDGATPNPRLILDGSGGVLGTTQGGGANGAGTVFRISPTGALLWSHSIQYATEGSTPMDGLAADALGSFYGTTSMGSTGNSGTLFRVTGSGAVRVVMHFPNKVDQHCPFTGVVLGPTGMMYGTTVGMQVLGSTDLGGLWSRTQAGAFTPLYSFANGTDGEYPELTPSLDGSGNLWGVMNNGTAANFGGAIWKLTSLGFSLIYDFPPYGSHGSAPTSPLLLARNGNFYGTTRYGGTGGCCGNGVVYEIAPSSLPGTAPTVVHAFTGGTDGSDPIGNLVLDASGHIYGGTSAGTIYKITP